MQALILAAGQGKRFGGSIPKALLRINNKSLIVRLIEQLQRLGIHDIVVVCGYQKQLLEEALKPYQVKIAFNPVFASSDNLASSWYGLQFIQEDCIFVHGDVVVEESLLQRVISSRREVVLPYDANSVDEESMKIRISEEAVVALCKELPPLEANGESIPLMKFSAKAFTHLKELINVAMNQREFDRLFDSAVLELLRKKYYSCEAMNVTGLKWCEIDTPADLQKAIEIFGK